MKDYIPRTTRQHIEGEMWVDSAAHYLLEMGVFSFSEVVQAREVAKKLLYFNKDEGGELMEVDARVFMREWIRELLED